MAVTEPREKLLLVVDDEEEIVTMFRFGFEREGFRVVTASNGQEALGTIRSQKVDLILLDLMMPVLGGFETLRMLQQEPQGRGVPVFVITAKHMDKSTQDMLSQESNVRAFFSKPVPIVNLVKKAHEVLETKSSDQRILEEFRKKPGVSPELEEQLRKAQKKIYGDA